MAKSKEEHMEELREALLNTSSHVYTAYGGRVPDSILDLARRSTSQVEAEYKVNREISDLERKDSQIAMQRSWIELLQDSNTKLKSRIHELLEENRALLELLKDALKEK